MPSEQTTHSAESSGPYHGDERNRKSADEALTQQPQEFIQNENENTHLQQDESQEWSCFTVNLRIPYVFCGIGIVVTVTAAVIGLLCYLTLRVPQPDVRQWMEEVEERVGAAGVDVFRSYDLNNDGYLSVFEFEELLPHIANLTAFVDKVKPVDAFPEYTPAEDEEVLVLQAHFTPLQLETMTREDFLSLDLGGDNPLFGLKNWTEPNKKHLMFGANEFQAFLPEKMTLGSPYYILKSEDPGLFQQRIHSSSRYFPIKPSGLEVVLHRLLAMMHPQPFVHMRFPPRGTVGCVRAFNDKYMHIIFRIHAEFQINRSPQKPFWFTPAQFLADLVISHDGKHVHYFHMRVPNERKLNVDMEWMVGKGEGEDSMEVDIGYMPLMEWTMDAESHLPLPDAQSMKPDYPKPQSPEEVEWTSEVSRKVTLERIERVFYPFKKVAYYNVTEAVQVSQKENKPVHGIFLWGALDDQSC